MPDLDSTPYAVALEPIYHRVILLKFLEVESTLVASVLVACSLSDGFLDVVVVAQNGYDKWLTNLSGS